MTTKYFRDDVLSMAGYVPGEQPQGGKFIKLNTNENPYPPSEKAIRAIQEAAAGNLARYPDPFATAFRQAASDVFEVPADWVLCGNGSDDILTIVTRAMVSQGQRVRYASPSYVLYRTLADIQGVQGDVVMYSADWSLPEDFTHVGSDVRLAYLANPNSPSGTCLSPAAVRDLASALPCPLLVDEAYVDFAEQSCIDLVSQCDNVMVSRSLSKSYALAGLRFGFLIAKPDWIAEFQKVKDSYNCDALSIAGAVAAIQDRQWQKTNKQQIVATRKRLEKELAGIGFSVQPSQANFVWCTHPDRNVQEIYQTLKDNQILVRYMDYPGWPAGLRITVGTDDQIDVFLQQLKEIVS